MTVKVNSNSNLVLLALVRSIRCDPVRNRPDVDHDRDPVNREQEKSEARRAGGNQQSQAQGDRRSEKDQQHADQSIAFIDMPESRDDAEQHRDHVAGLAFRSFQSPVAAVGERDGCSIVSATGVSVYSKVVPPLAIVTSARGFVKAAFGLPPCVEDSSLAPDGFLVNTGHAEHWRNRPGTAFLVGLRPNLFAAVLSGTHDLVVAGATANRPSLGGVRVTYLGTNGYQFEAGDHALLVDPYFSRVGLGAMIFGTPIQPNGQRISEALHRLTRPDAILVSHGHIDHLFDAPAIMKITGARLLASRTAIQLAQAAGAAPAQCDAVTAGDVRRIGPWKIHVLGATHDRVFLIGVPFSGSRKQAGAPRKASDWVCGEPLAFLIEIHGQRIYLDAGGTMARLPPANIGPVDLAILGVALPDSRARFSAAVRRLRPRYLLPSHQDDFFRPLNRGFAFGPLTDFPRVRRDDEREELPGRLILLDYFRPWILP